jgi:phosphate transport system permease protein
MANASAAATVVRGSLRAQSRDWGGMILQVVLILSLLFSLATLAVLLFDQLTKGLPVFQERGIDFLTSGLSSNPAKAGVLQGLVGTVLMAVLVSLLAFPLGIATAVYLRSTRRTTASRSSSSSTSATSPASRRSSSACSA